MKRIKFLSSRGIRIVGAKIHVGNENVNTFTPQVYNLTEENRRLARHLVRNGKLVTHEKCFESVTSMSAGVLPEGDHDYTFWKLVPHFCDDCAHKGETILHNPSRETADFMNTSAQRNLKPIDSVAANE